MPQPSMPPSDALPLSTQALIARIKAAANSPSPDQMAALQRELTLTFG